MYGMGNKFKYILNAYIPHPPFENFFFRNIMAQFSRPAIAANGSLGRRVAEPSWPPQTEFIYGKFCRITSRGSCEAN